MGVDELEELKKQIKELQEKGLFALVLHLGEHLLYLLIRKMAHEECVSITGPLMK
jgi:hypothetical protein